MQSSANKPLVIGIPGSFDSANYASYRSWLSYIPELGANVRILDMLQLPGIKRIGHEDATGSIYYCDWQPEDYLHLILDTIEETRPSKVVLLGFGSGAHEAIRSASALSVLGKPVAGVIGIAPHPLTYTREAGPEDGGLAELATREADLRTQKVAGDLLLDSGLASDQLLSCVRYEDIRTPHNGSRNTFYVPRYVLERYAKASKRLPLVSPGNLHEVLSGTGPTTFGSTYKTPTAFIAAADSWYLPSVRVKSLARRARQAPTSYANLRGVEYDFRAHPSQVDHVTETIMDKIGQVLTTGTIQDPRPSHTLLVHHKKTTEQHLDTIMLSSARPPFHHKFAVQLAKEANANLIVLASHNMRPDIVATDMASAGVRGCIIDMPAGYELPLTSDFATTKHPLVATRASNLYVKRNIGLLYGHLTGQKLFFLDDDIRGMSASRLKTMSALLDRHAVAGFLANSYPDNSVVCHANRLAGNTQPTFISGGSLGVNTSFARSFFPQIYNEDWLFCYEAVLKRDAALLGSVRQLPYDPFNPMRAISEEFGDVLAEGLQYLLTVGVSLDIADEAFWRYYLWRRRNLIAKIKHRLVTLRHLNNDKVQHALVAIEASQDTLNTFAPHHFVKYVRDWKSDTRQWNQILDTMPKNVPTHEALRLIADSAHLKMRPIGM